MLGDLRIDQARFGSALPRLSNVSGRRALWLGLAAQSISKDPALIKPSSKEIAAGLEPARQCPAAETSTRKVTRAPIDPPLMECNGDRFRLQES
jgi:hypothetical protein